MVPSMGLPSVSWMLLSCLMLLSQVQGEDSEKQLSSPRNKCPRGSYAYRFHCYALFRTPKSWPDADVACQNRPSGNLVSILSGAEASFVASLVKNTLNTNSNIWIGFHDPTEGYELNGNGWEWSSNDIVNYVNWERTPSTSYCGSLSQNSAYLKWRDHNCYNKLPYICKFTD